MATTKKKAGKKKATGKKSIAKRGGSKALANKDALSWLEQLAQKESAREVGGDFGPSLRIRGGRFSLGDDIIGEELDVVVVASVHVKSYYGTAYNAADEGGSPDCFAASVNPEEFPLAPDPKRVKNPINAACADCEFNEFGSADTGNGKACGDKRHLLVIAADDLDAYMAGEEVVFARLSVPATSLKNWIRYTKNLQKKLKRPVFSVVTHLEFDPEYDYPVLLFSMREEINDVDTLKKLNEHREASEPELLVPWTQSADADAEEKKGKKKAASKKRGSKLSGGRTAKKKTTARGKSSLSKRR